MILSIIVPAITASLTTLIMYLGELILMGGKLYIYGDGLLFHAIGAIPFSVADFAIILFSGLMTYIILHNLNKAPKVMGEF